MDRIIVIGLIASIAFGIAAHKARKAKRPIAANLHGFAGIAGYVVSVGSMI